MDAAIVANLVLSVVEPMSCGEPVMRDAGTRVNYGTSSPRKDGAAIPEPLV